MNLRLHTSIVAFAFIAQSYTVATAISNETIQKRTASLKTTLTTTITTTPTGKTAAQWASLIEEYQKLMPASLSPLPPSSSSSSIEHRRRLELSEQECEAIGDAYEVLTRGYAVGGFCDLDASADGPTADFIRFMQDHFIPTVDLAIRFGIPRVSITGDDGRCFPPLATADIIKKLLASVISPCTRIKEFEGPLNFFSRLEKILKAASKMPFIKTPARLLHGVVKNIVGFFKEKVDDLDFRCTFLINDVEIYASKLFNLIIEFRKVLEWVVFSTSIYVDILCAIENVEIQAGRGTRRARRDRRTLRGNRLLKQLAKQHKNIFGSEQHDHGRRLAGLHGRRLGFNVSALNYDILEDIADEIGNATAFLNGYGSALDGVSTDLRAAFRIVNDLLDQSLLGEFNSAVAHIRPITDIIGYIVDKLKFLKCPKKKLGIFGFLCDLDVLVIEAIKAILEAFGVPDIDESIRNAITNILEPLFNIPDLNVFPDVSILSAELDVDSVLVQPLRDRVNSIRNKLLDFDPLTDAFTNDGTPDVVIDGVGALEFRRVKGDLETVEVHCNSTQFPYILTATKANSCGNVDIARFVELPCAFDSNCTIDVGPLGVQLPNCGAGGGGFFDFDLTSRDSTEVLFLCVTQEQFENIASLPPVLESTILGETPNYDTYVCHEDFQLREVGYQYGYQQGETECVDSKIYTQASFDARSDKIAFLRTQSSICIFGNLCINYNICLGTAGACGADRTYILAMNYLCLVPGRDFIDDNEEEDEKIDIHLAAVYRYSGIPIFCVCAPGSCCICRESHLYQRLDSYVDQLSMTCPNSNEVVHVIEVLSQTQGGVVDGDPLVDETERFQTLCAGNQTCEYAGVQKLYDDVDGLTGFFFRLYRATYECLVLCDPGHILIPEPGTGDCIPCGVGRFRSDEMETCESCPPGSFSNNTIETECEICPKGSYSTEGSNSCELCPVGSTTNTSGSSSELDCELCPANTYAPGDGSALCLSCDPGEESLPGSSNCTLVPEGSFRNVSGTALCPPGFYSDQPGATQCLPCDIGSYTRDFGSTECSLCGIGTYGNVTNQTECYVCGPGTSTYKFGANSSSDCEPLPEAVQYSSGDYDGWTCEAVLGLDLDDNIDEETRSAILARRLSQVGDGSCNGVGPWNTRQCGFDGGDCCQQSCVVPDEDDVPEDKLLSDLACESSTYSCLNPTFAGVPWEESCDDDDDDDGVLAGDNATCDALNLDPERQGDGVCDKCLNVEEFDFDGGDCCAQTCEENIAFPNSCGSFCDCAVEPEAIVDTTAPTIIFEKPPEVHVDVQVSRLLRPPFAFADDNSPVVFKEGRTDGRCPNEYSLSRSWNATDAAGNMAFVEETIDVFDDEPPLVVVNPRPRLTCLFPIRNPRNAGTSVVIPLERFNEQVDQCGNVDAEHCVRSTRAVFIDCQVGNGQPGTHCSFDPSNGGFLLTSQLFGSSGGGEVESFHVLIGQEDVCGNPSVERVIEEFSIRRLNQPIPEECDVVLSYDDSGNIGDINNADMCAGSPLPFNVVDRRGRDHYRGCDWVGRAPGRRCGFDGVETMCPSECNVCGRACRDGQLPFRFRKGKKSKIKDCNWVSKKATKRCRIQGVKDACPETCGVCSNGSSNGRANIFASN